MLNGDAPRFDAYYKWLGIPRREQPPNHYRILAVKLYEADAQVIQSAAARQSAFVLDCAKEKHQELGQKLVGEIAAARECLLDPQAKAAYDAELRKQLPKTTSRATRQSRFDVQVAHGAQYEVPEVELPTTAAPPPELLAIKEDPPVPPPPKPPVKEEPAAIPLMGEQPMQSKPPRPARRTLARGKRPPAVAAVPAVRPPVSMRPAVIHDGGGSDLNTGKIVKLVVILCLLAAAITVGLLKWMSSIGRSQSAESTAVAGQSQAPRATTAPAAPTTRAAGFEAESPFLEKGAGAESVDGRSSTSAPAGTGQAAAEHKTSSPTSQSAPAANAKPDPRSEYWPKLANSVILMQPQQGGPSTLNINEDGTYESANFGSGKWNMKGATLLFIGKLNVVKFNYDPATDTIIGDRATGRVISRKALTAASQTQQPPTSAPAAPAHPAAAPAARAAAPQTPAPASAAPAVPSESGWIFPLRSIISFRNCWLKGEEQGSVDFDEATNTVLIDSSEELGGFSVKKPWKEISFTMHAESITGRLEIQVNKTTLKFNTATVLIRRPATIVIQYDPSIYKLTANIGSRQVASATVLEENLTSRLACRFRCEGGKAKIKLSEVKVFIP